MPVSENSVANLKSKDPLPVGTIRKANGKYYKRKLEDGRWVYTHTLAAQEALGRRLRPNERVHFFPDREVNHENPVYGVDFEVWLIPPKDGIPPGTRRKLIKKILQAEYDLTVMKEQLAETNQFFKKAPGDMDDPGISADWAPKDSRIMSGLG